MGNAVYRILLLALMTSASAASPENTLETLFRNLDPGALGHPVETRELNFSTHHPQGMTAAGDCFYLSSVEVTDRAAEKGTGYLIEMDRQGSLLRTITLGEGPLYHPGGIDFDGTNIWVPVAAYRSDSAAIVYTVNPETLQSKEVFRFKDHLGAISHFPKQHLLIGVNWGSRRFYRWKTKRQGGEWIVRNPDHPDTQFNGNHYIDYQDIQRVPGTSFLLCAGLRTYTEPGRHLPSLHLGGIDLVHIRELRAHHQLPMPLRPSGRRTWTQNPFYVESCEQGLRFFFIPEDSTSRMYIFEVGIKK